jgi:hypothetical protein
MLKSAREEAVKTSAKVIIEFARKWGATIPPEQESQAINQLKEFFEEPATWPTIKVATETGTLSTASTPAPRGRPKNDSDPAPKEGKRKASDFAEVKVADGQAWPTCPTIIKSGDRKDQACGKNCVRALDDHDPKNLECAQLKCNHLYCGTHVVAAAGMNVGAARKRLEKASTSNDAPVTVSEEVKSTTLNTGVLDELKPAATSGAGKAALSKIFNKVKERKAGNTSGESPPSVENSNN